MCVCVRVCVCVCVHVCVGVCVLVCVCVNVLSTYTSVVTCPDYPSVLWRQLKQAHS